MQLPRAVVKESTTTTFSKPRYILWAAGLNYKEMSVCETLCEHVCDIQPLCAKGNLCPLCHPCLTLWTLCCRPMYPSVCPSLYIPACVCSLWLVSLRYDIPSGVSVCVCGCVSCQKRVLPWSPGTVPSTRCAVGCISWTELCQDTKFPSLQAQILLHVNTKDPLQKPGPKI